MLLTPAAFYAAGLIKRDSYLKRTGLLAAEAWVDVNLTSIAFRSAMRRTRPDHVPPGGSFSDTWFKTGAHPIKPAGSFPSGWVPFVAYGLATLGGVSRLSSQQHYVSEVFFGGVSIGRFVVLRQ